MPFSGRKAGSRVLREIFGLKNYTLTEKCKSLHNCELFYLYSSSNPDKIKMN
jgi:hypothetical protein